MTLPDTQHAARPQVQFYRRLGSWRWRVTAANGRKVAAASEGYHNRADAIDNFTLVTARFVRGSLAVFASGDPANPWDVFGLH